MASKPPTPPTSSGTPPLIFPEGQNDLSPRFNIQLQPYAFGGMSNFQPGLAKDTPTTSIYLPLPTQGMVENYKIDFDSDFKLGALGGSAAAVSKLLAGDIEGAGTEAVSGLTTLGRQIGKGIVEFLGDVVPGVGGDTAGNLYDLAAGNIINPNYAILFKGIKPREFSFTWVLSARNRAESGAIYKIIHTLKKSSLPKKSMGANFLLNYPDIAYIGLYGPNKANESGLNSIYMTFSKMGTYITNISIDYVGGGDHVAVFKENNAPVQVRLTLTFLERSIITSDDVIETVGVG